MALSSAPRSAPARQVELFGLAVGADGLSTVVGGAWFGPHYGSLRCLRGRYQATLPRPRPRRGRRMSTVSVPTPLDYLAAGLKLIAIPHGSKAPRDDGWQLEQNCIHTIEAWQGPRPSGDEGRGRPRGLPQDTAPTIVARPGAGDEGPQRGADQRGWPPATAR